ncbi:MAG: tRNA lysidine(34) synthetase TilS [Xanthomonadales bacterium]|nr:tRNA lysidine(34) synthetase TilS [Xanthomonadales bacterium]
MSELASLLDARLSRLPDGPVVVGFSGGLDSTVLLHALASCAQARQRGLSALHVCHHLHPDSPRWAAQAHGIAQSLGVAFDPVDVVVDTITEEGVEAAARRARYRAFAQQVPASGVLALAHHRDDQVETVLLRLLHGAGNEGLAGMRSLRRLHGEGSAWLWRPLLDQPRSTLEAYAHQHGLRWIDDPANAQPEFARNRVRHRVVPVLREAFPQAEARLLDAAQRLREESDALSHCANQLLIQHRDPRDGSLPSAILRELPAALLRRLIGLWLTQMHLPRPPAGIWPRIMPELVLASADATPQLAWRGAQLRRHRDRVYGLGADVAEAAAWSIEWDGTSDLALPNAAGTLAFDPPLSAPQAWQVRTRRGGESLLQNGHHRSLKKLLQEAGIAPWQRAHLPLLFDDADQLASIGARWHSDAFAQWLHQHDKTLRLR